MIIGIFGRSFSTEVIPQIQLLIKSLTDHGAELRVFEPFLNFLTKNKVTSEEYETFISREQIGDVDYMISIGGDGTLLESVTFTGAYETPTLGINAGRLGFLASITIDRISEALNALYKKNYSVDKRILVELKSNTDLFGDTSFGLNEFAILKRDTSSMIVVHTYLDDEFLNSYWADGLIVSTPTGSTGYSLACGGPLVMPQTSNFIIAPVNPHNLNVRPMIVSDESTLKFKIEGRSKKFLVSLDSRSKSIDASVELTVSKADFHAQLIVLKDAHFFHTLRNKLNWGLDIRN